MKDEVKTIVVHPEEEYKKLEEVLGGKVVSIDYSKCTFINPFEIVDSKVERLKYKAKDLLMRKKYKKAYKTMRKIKKINQMAMSDGIKRIYSMMNRRKDQSSNIHTVSQTMDDINEKNN